MAGFGSFLIRRAGFYCRVSAESSARKTFPGINTYSLHCACGTTCSDKCRSSLHSLRRIHTRNNFLPFINGIYLSKCLLEAPYLQTLGSYTISRGFRSSAADRFLDVRDKDHDKKSKELVVHQGQYFDEVARKARNKKTFHEALKLYIKRNESLRRGHVEFIYAAIDRMKEFDVHRDLETYKRVLELFPKYKMVPRNTWQVEFMHFPKQQQCCIDVLDFMEGNGVIPDDEMGYQLLKIFGPDAHAFRKYRRMMYWLPKFNNASPYPVPFHLPTDDIELATLAVKRMCVDIENVVSVFKSEELETAVDHTYIVSAQSPAQQRLIAEHPRHDKPIFVEGGFKVWMRMKSLTYFVLRADCTDRYRTFQESKIQSSDEEMFNWSIFEEESPKVLSVPPSVHEGDDGTILSLCVTGTSSKDSLASWIKYLERTNPALAEIPVVFQLQSPGMDLKMWEEPVQKKSDLI